MILYFAGWNQPGCLPDVEPETFENLEDAWTYLADQAQRVADQEFIGDLVQWNVMSKFSEEMSAKKQEDDFEISPDGWCYFVSKEDVSCGECDGTGYGRCLVRPDGSAGTRLEPELDCLSCDGRGWVR